MPEAFVVETLRIARPKAWPRGGFGGVSPAGLGVAVLVERVAS